MTVSSLFLPVLVIHDALGTPLPFAKVYSFAAGTSTPLAMFQDSGGVTAHAHPAIADASGQIVAYLTDGVGYKINVQTSGGVQVQNYPVDNVFSNATTVSASLPNFGGSGGSALIGYLPAGTGAVTRTLQAQLRDVAFITDFADRNITITDWSPVYALAKAHCEATGKALFWPAGTYPHSQTITVTASQFQMTGLGNVILNHTGAGVAVEVDGGVSSGYVLNVLVENFTVQGNINTTTAWHFRSVHRSNARRLRARDCNTAFDLEFVIELVCDNFSCSVNEGAFAIKTPTKGTILRERSIGEYCVAATFLNLNMEGIAGPGLQLLTASRCVFLGGTSEGNTGANGYGVEFGPSTSNIGNTFNTFWMELNQAPLGDVVCYGIGHVFDQCRMVTFTNVNGQSVTIRDGFCAIANLQATSKDTLFLNTQMTSTSTSITGSGTWKAINRVLVDGNYVVTSRPKDKLDTAGAWTPTIYGFTTAGTPTYTVRIGSWFQIGIFCHINGHIELSDKGGMAGPILISGLPFLMEGIVASDETSLAGVGYFSGVLFDTGYTFLGGRINVGQSVISLFQSGNNLAAFHMTSAYITDTFKITFSMTYPISLG